MIMSHSICGNLRHQIIAISSAFLLWFHPDLFAAGFTISPASISNTFSGNISLVVTNISSGATVRIEEFIDVNKNGAVDTTDMLVASFHVTDGQVTAFGGITDNNIPGDQDGVAGKITTSIAFANTAEAGRVSGPHLFRISSPTSAFSSVVHSLGVTPFPFSQSVAGTVTRGGAPVANAVVGLLLLVGAKDTEFVAGALTDASGNYSLAAPAGTYLMFTFKAGLISAFGSPQITINANQALSQNLTMTAATNTVSGMVTDSVTGAGLPGVQILVQSATTNTGTLTFSDTNGNFSLAVTPDNYKLNLSDNSLGMLGYIRPGTKPKVNATAGNVTGVSVPLAKATALVYGSLKTAANQPLAGVSINGSDSAFLYQSSSLTDSNGNYSLGVLGGTDWSFGPDSSNPLLAGYSVQGTNVTLAANQAVKVDFVATHITAHLRGRVTDNTGAPQGGVTLFAAMGNGSANAVQATTAADGSFDLGVFGGTWNMSVAFNGTAYNWMAPTLVFNVTDGLDISNIAFVVQKATAAITGSVHDPQGAGVPGAYVSASGSLNGTNYYNTTATDQAGNYALGVANGSWQVGIPDCLGYGCPTNNFQTVSVNGANIAVNFLFTGPAQLSLYFRHFAYGGDFGAGLTPVTPFPISIAQYVAVLTAQNATAYPSPNEVFFTGPSGSGLIGTPASDAVPGNNSTAYFSPPVTTPSTAPGGSWTITYNGSVSNLNIPEPQAASRLLAIVPTASVNSGLLTGVSWAYKDSNGVLLAAAPQFLTQVQFQVFDKDLNALTQSPGLTPNTTTYSFPLTPPWSSIGRVRAIYFDSLGNRYFVNFNRASANLAGAMQLGNNRFQFQVSGLIFQNYTIQYSTTLTNWNTLYVTNAPAGLFDVVDANASGSQRFYRVLEP